MYKYMYNLYVIYVFVIKESTKEEGIGRYIRNRIELVRVRIERLIIYVR